ncbi:MAG: protein kinase [Candidatus Eisenbacteria bacterium]
MEADLAGRTVSHFRILDKLGEGGMGVVYKAEDTRLQRAVALKFVSHHILCSAKAAARFIREAQAAAACEHPNVCTIYEVGDSDEGTFIAMAYIEGRSLKDRIASGALCIDEAVDIAIQVARGLGAAHRRGIIHRDVKPGNIMMTPEGLAKIMDFGLARPSDATRLTKDGSAVGTIAYMSPEQTRGLEVDERSDIWALGVVLYEMLTGRRPFRGGYDQAVVHSILNDEPDLMADAQQGVPAELARVVSRALAKSPSGRYQRVEEMLAELLRLGCSGAEPATKLVTVEGAGCRLTNIPVQLTSFVGRSEVVAEVVALLRRERLLTLAGAGGSGKTRLALEVGTAMLQSLPDGAWLAELAALRDPALVPQTVAGAMGLMDAPNRTPTEALADHLRGRNMMLILDNCEHLLGECARLADRILRACPDVRILTTSREPLATEGETVFRVPSLPVPDADDRLSLAELAQVGAVRLFVERAAATEAGFHLTDDNAEAIGDITRRLNGIPLALELAAARTSVLSAGDIAERLEDRFVLLCGGSRAAPARHQTLRALVDWSYEQLCQREQILLGRLSVFSGGWTLESAEAVCAGDGIEEKDVLGLMSNLVRKSLAEKLTSSESGASRYRLHETILAYARERVSDAEHARLAKGHLDYFLEVAERAEIQLCGGEQATSLRRLEGERENLRTALETCLVESAGIDVGLRLLGAMGPYWEMSGHWTEGRDVCRRLLRHPEAGARTATRSRALRLGGSLARRQGDYEDARVLLEEALEISQETGDRRGVAESLWHLGVVAWREGDASGARAVYERSLASARDLSDGQLVSRCLNSMAALEEDWDTRHGLYLESLELARGLQDRDGEAVVLCNLGSMASNAGRYEEGLSLLERGLASYRELGQPRGVAVALLSVADVAADVGDLERARPRAEEGLRLTRKLGARHWESYALSILGRVARLEGDLERARELFEENLPIAEEAGDRSEAHAFLGLGLVFLDLGDYDRARGFLVESLRLYWKHMFERGAADAIEGLARLATVDGSQARAARLFGGADGLRREHGCPVHPVDESRIESWLAAARNELGDREFEREWSVGRSMPAGRAIEYACARGSDGGTRSPRGWRR